MIQVLERANSIIGYLSTKNKATMAEITTHVRLNLTTVCNIVKTMTNLKWIEKNGFYYSLGKRLFDLAYQDIKRYLLLAVTEENAQKLTDKIKEGVIISMLYRYEKYNIIKTNYNREVQVNTSHFSVTSIYGNADSRVLLAFADKKDLQIIVEKYGIPKYEWEGVGTFDDLMVELEKIKKKKLAIRTSKSSDTTGIAAPIFGYDGLVWAAIGVFLPSVRLTGSHKKKVIKELKIAADNISYFLSLQNIRL